MHSHYPVYPSSYVSPVESSSGRCGVTLMLTDGHSSPLCCEAGALGKSWGNRPVPVDASQYPHGTIRFLLLMRAIILPALRIAPSKPTMTSKLR